MADRLSVKEEAELLPFLVAHLSGWSRKKIKERLRNGCVQVNGSTVTQHNHPLEPGDRVSVLPAGKGQPGGAVQELEILYRDDALVAIHKPAGLLAVAPTRNEGVRHALDILRRQLTTRGRPLRLWPVHRLDRETSGVMLFATSRPLREKVAANWTRAEKTYLAVVEGCPDPKEGTIDQPLWLDPKINQMHVGDHPKAKAARTQYTVKRTGNGRALLEVQILTGRQHQIRAHLAWAGWPVVGDERYGSAGGRMGLHALRLKVRHPQSGEGLTMEASVPAELSRLLRGKREIKNQKAKGKNQK